MFKLSSALRKVPLWQKLASCQVSLPPPLPGHIDSTSIHLYSEVWSDVFWLMNTSGSDTYHFQAWPTNTSYLPSILLAVSLWSIRTLEATCWRWQGHRMKGSWPWIITCRRAAGQLGTPVLAFPWAGNKYLLYLINCMVWVCHY